MRVGCGQKPACGLGGGGPKSDRSRGEEEVDPEQFVAHGQHVDEDEVGERRDDEHRHAVSERVG
jgi:hypothetical protein